MPSLPDLNDDTQQLSSPAVADAVAPADVLERVKSEGLRRRTRRHRRNAALVMAAVLAVALPAVTLLPGDGDGTEEVRVASSPDPGSSTSSSESDEAPATTATTLEPAPTTAQPVIDPALPPAAAPEEPEPGVAPAPRPVPTTAAPAPVCRNSTDPACGDFRWDPAPAADQPVTVTITASNTAPAVGEEVVFTVTWSDPDAPDAEASFANGEDGVVLGTADTFCRERYGAWTPPSPTAGFGTMEFRYTYSQAGTFTAEVLLESVDPAAGGCDNYDPYSSTGTASVTITVG